MNEKIICEIVVPNYVNKVQFSAARKAKYFIKDKTKIADKYLNGVGTNYFWKTVKGKTLLHTSKGELVIANPKAVGTPSIKPIKGNDFYSGFASIHQRMKIVETIKTSFTKQFNKIKKFNKYPLYVEFIYFDILEETKIKSSSKVQDLDNSRFAYEKCSLDLLKKLKKITDDNLNFVRKLSSEFIPVQPNERKLIVTFYNYIPSRNSDGTLINKIE